MTPSHRLTATFDRDTTPGQRELVRLHGPSTIFALGEPVRVVDWGTGKKGIFAPIPPLKRIEPCTHREGSSMEERVAVELDHLHYHAGHPMNDKVQIECSPAYWREFCMAQDIEHRVPSCDIYAPSRPVSFGSRRGDLQRAPVLGVPVVVVPDGGEAVLRPRWPETVRLVQGG